MQLDTFVILFMGILGFAGAYLLTGRSRHGAVGALAMFGVVLAAKITLGTAPWQEAPGYSYRHVTLLAKTPRAKQLLAKAMADDIITNAEARRLVDMIEQDENQAAIDRAKTDIKNL